MPRRDLNGLVWDKGEYIDLRRNNGESAWVGQIRIGWYMQTQSGDWHFHTDGIWVKHITLAAGNVKTKASAKRAVERAWLMWSELANVVPRLTPAEEKS